jgi:hypothetical protein
MACSWGLRRPSAGCLRLTLKAAKIGTLNATATAGGVIDMRRLVLILVAAFVLLTLGLRANGGIELRGHLSANETEMQEGYFAVAQDTVLMVRPGSPLHNWLKDHQGQVVRVVVEPAATR